MSIVLPSVRKRTSHPNGEIIKELLRSRKIDSKMEKLQKGNNEYYRFRDKGNEIIVVNKNTSHTFEDHYRYVLRQTESTWKEEAGDIDLSNYRWIKHPLLEVSFESKFTRDSVFDTWKDAFEWKVEDSNRKGLRIPQVGALHAIQAHWTISNQAGIVVLPTGTGKTDTMLSCLFVNKIPLLLVIVPTDALRDQLANKFLSLGILHTFGLIDENCESPIVGLLSHRIKSIEEAEDYFSRVNVVISTMSVLAGCSSDVQTKIASLTSHLFIDEAHHTAAETWRIFKNKFLSSKILLFTATPFRNDGKRLEGKIIFNFPLVKAQELGYFEPINFVPVHEYEYKIADRQIAEKAIEQLNSDLLAGFDHILMVRVNSIERGKEIFPLYSQYQTLNPVLVHSQIRPKSVLKRTISDIIGRKHRVIICVDMLGEGFDLPELKIAAFHDTKKSLTITLQIAGRFTRVKHNLGPATFIANIADPEVNEDLEDLYYRDSDWNILLPDLSYKMSLEQEDFRQFLEGFKGFPDKFPVQAIRHPLSTLIFRTISEEWTPLKYKEGIKGVDSYEYVYPDYNKSQEILIVIVGKRSKVKWANVQDFEGIAWDIIICHFDKVSKLIYLHASNTNSSYTNFIDAICQGATLINGQEIFRCFHGVNRIRLHNVGVREPLGRAINFIMRVGSDIRTALRDAEIKKAIKSNVFGVGFEHGARVSIGCSHHGRIWSMRTNNILTWVRWCKAIAAKVTDSTIDPDTVLKGTLIPQDIGSVPDEIPFAIEWPDVVFRQSIGNFYIEYGNEEYPIWNCDILLKNKMADRIIFDVILPSGYHEFELHIFKKEGINGFMFLSKADIFLKEGNSKENLRDFFFKYPPLIYFVDGSFLEGNLYTKILEIISGFSVDKFELSDWIGIDIKKESQTYQKFTDSIQYSMIKKLLAEGKYSVLMDDDDKGEIADIIGFKVFEEQRLLLIDLYHCKHSSKTLPGLRVDDFYVVCGQAQRSIKWMEDIDEIFKHLGRRSRDRLKKLGTDRFEIGDENLLEVLRRRAKKDLKVRMNVFIVQPGLSFGDYTEESEVSKLLAVVETYLKETWNANLTVIASE